MASLRYVLAALVLVAACGGTQKGPVGPPPEYEDPEPPVPMGSAAAHPGSGPSAPPDEPPPAAQPSATAPTASSAAPAPSAPRADAGADAAREPTID
jgi:hypothetical protein